MPRRKKQEICAFIPTIINEALFELICLASASSAVRIRDAAQLKKVLRQGKGLAVVILVIFLLVEVYMPLLAI